MADGKSGIKEKLLQAAAHLEHGFITAKHTLKESLHLLDPVMIMPYYGYGNDTCVYLKGRVIEKEKIKEKKEGASTLRHLKNTYRRYESDEIPGIRVGASYGGRSLEMQTDDEGFFEFAFRFDQPIDYEKAGNKMQLRLLETKGSQDILEAEGIIFVPSKGSEFGIISDIDDTVLVSNITHLLGKLKLMLLKDATERSPFPGIAAFLRALCSGYDNRGSNPLFYVSGSEWNLFDLLVNFFQYHDIPEGPLFLRDKGTRFDKPDAAPSEQEYKLLQIRRILDTFPHLNFICIGDSGQHDPEIYQQVVAEYPGRILGIYIRDVSGEKRDREVHRIAEAVTKGGTEMMLLPETLSAARHALQMKWINEDQLARVEEECRKDDRAG
ncbi:MAG TPA: phosphatase domain-containing protein [Flavisolibacter sp.]|jgi:phosphatidate phosphatase APP1|nr:phosphatase domain-containing protein [Flavisolibacter sp.]